MAKGVGNASDGNPVGQEVIDGGKGGKNVDFGFTDQLVGATGPAKAATKPVSEKVNTPDGQVIK